MKPWSCQAEATNQKAAKQKSRQWEEYPWEELFQCLWKPSDFHCRWESKQDGSAFTEEIRSGNNSIPHPVVSRNCRNRSRCPFFCHVPIGEPKSAFLYHQSIEHWFWFQFGLALLGCQQIKVYHQQCEQKLEQAEPKRWRYSKSWRVHERNFLQSISGDGCGHFEVCVTLWSFACSVNEIWLTFC